VSVVGYTTWGRCSKELPLFLIGFGGVVHNMNKKVTKFSSENKQLKKIFFSWGTIRGGGGMFRSLKKASGEKKQILQKKYFGREK
jgi:hypothetical protein